jgi:prepilin-type N-terminal cleavage/methylation domain-containing protein
MNRQKRPAAAGFTLIEIIVVVGILGIFLAASYPHILNTMESRNLENNARRIQTYLQQTKNRAVDVKVNHRVRFTRADTPYWTYDMERIQVDGTWVKAEGAPRNIIPPKFAVTINLPVEGSDFVVEFSPLGTIVNLPVVSNAQYSITLQSRKLNVRGQMDQRVLNLFMGGSIQYLKQKS